MPALLFICTGNQCRSPLAAILLRQLLQQLLQLQEATEWQIESAGTWAVTGRSVPPLLRQVAQTAGLDLQTHRARRIEQVPMLERFDLIITMEMGQKEALSIEFPTLSARIHLLSALAGAPYDIADPMGGSRDDYQGTLYELERLLQLALPQIISLCSVG